MFNKSTPLLLSSAMIMEAAGPSETSVDFLILQRVTDNRAIFMVVSVRAQCRAKYHSSVNTQ